MTAQYAQGTLVWIKHDEEVWVQGEIVTTTAKEILVETPDDGVKKLGPNDPMPLRTPDVYTSEGLTVVDDLTQLIYLHEPAVLHSLQIRFDTDKIYTFTGPILIAVNPFKRIKGLYDDKLMKSFMTHEPQTRPHVFSTANASFRGICDRQKNQTLLISGESGAGKTETTKYAMKFLAMAGSGGGEPTPVEQQILSSNPILEGFGNAKTSRNDNSSRFGKFIELQFQKDGTAVDMRLCGARIRSYLLEKVRVTEQAEGERNYHIFYEACAARASIGAETTYKFPQLLNKEKINFTETELDLQGFDKLETFAYLTRSSVKTLKNVNDVDEFEQRIAAMQTIGIPQADIQSMLNTIAAVLHLGNTKFDAMTGNSEASTVMKESETAFQMICKLTGVGRQALEKALCNSTLKTRQESVTSPVDVRHASDNRDALAKALYGMVFTYMVGQTNTSIGYLDHVKLFVGILDIFGFECFKLNSFEQLCINFTNERLQQFFIQFVFKLEEKLYAREGIAWDPLDFPDNQDVVDMLQGKGGVLAMLDEECIVPRGSDQGFCNKLIKGHTGHRRFDVIKTKPSWFVIKHFAGPVPYCSDQFLDKNKDQMNNDIIECMGGSENAFVANMFKTDVKYQDVFNPQEDAGAGGKKRKKYSVSAEFKEQLNNLMELVDTTEPHFVRCVKPNPQNEAGLYDRKGVTEQLRYGGVLQVVQVSRAGYPVRINHVECWDDYRIIADSSVSSELHHMEDVKERANKLMVHLDVKLKIPMTANGFKAWAVGKTLVFFKQSGYEVLKFAREALINNSIIKIQSSWRRKMQVGRYKDHLNYTRLIQALLLGKMARIVLAEKRRVMAATTIQTQVRKRKCRIVVRKAIKVVVRIQSWRRAFFARKSAKNFRFVRGATTIQRQWRRSQEQKVYKAFRLAINVCQQRWRMRGAKAQLKKLKAEAADIGAQKAKEAMQAMAKAQQAAEQAAEIRKQNEVLESKALQMKAEAAAAQAKMEQMEEAAAAQKAENETLKAGVEEAAQKVHEDMTGTVEKMKVEAEDKDAEIARLKEQLEELAALKIKYAELEESRRALQERYDQSLKNQTMGGATRTSFRGAINFEPPARKVTLAEMTDENRSASRRNVDIQLVGTQGVGKTSLLETLIQEHDPSQMDKFNDQRGNVVARHQLQIGEKPLTLLDCSGNVRAQQFVKKRFDHTHWVIVVYDMSDAKSLIDGKEMVKEASAAGARTLLFGNTFNVENGVANQVDLLDAKDFANSNNSAALEGASLSVAVQNCLKMIEEGVCVEAPTAKSITKGRDTSCLSVLRPSLKAPKEMKQASTELLPVSAWQASDSIVTCICFGQEAIHKAYVLFATAAKDGAVVIYRCYRTKMENQMLMEGDFTEDIDTAFAAPPTDGTNIAVHSRFDKHLRAITSIFFNHLEDQLITTSIDKSVRFWDVDSGEMLKLFTDSSPVTIASFLPFNPNVLVAANSNAVLRLVNVENGTLLQKLKVETEVRALTFDDTGLFLLAGTKKGSIHVLDAADSHNLKFKFKVQLARGGVTCITFVPASDGRPSSILVNTSDCSATVIDVTYNAGVMTALLVRRRVRIAHERLPLKCCYSPCGPGYLISGSEDNDVYIYSLEKNSNSKVQYLNRSHKKHQAPVVAVAVNAQSTLLASADSNGLVVFWRTMDVSHLQDQAADV